MHVITRLSAVTHHSTCGTLRRTVGTCAPFVRNFITLGHPSPLLQSRLIATTKVLSSVNASVNGRAPARNMSRDHKDANADGRKTVLVTRRLPPKAMARLEAVQGINLLTWDSEQPIARADLLSRVRGTWYCVNGACGAALSLTPAVTYAANRDKTQRNASHTMPPSTISTTWRCCRQRRVCSSSLPHAIDKQHYCFVFHTLLSRCCGVHGYIAQRTDLNPWSLSGCFGSAGVDGLLCLLTDKIDTELLDAAGPSLKVVSSMSVGIDHIDASACRLRGISIGNTPGVLTEATADIALMLALMAARRAVEATEAVRSGEWGAWQPLWMCGRDIAGATVGIVGLGRIGAAVARRMRACGASTVLYSGSRKKKDAAAEVAGEFVPLGDLLRRSDFVFATCALNDATKGLFDYAAFTAMKPTAVFVNTSRGGVVNQDDLVRVLTERRVFAAGLDVTTPEPLPTDHPLLSLRNCVVLPHIGSATIDTREAMASLAVDNVIRGLVAPLPPPS
eukprot:Opistho-2@29897